MKHRFSQRIIYADTDAEGVVYYANYLAFFERGRDELIRQMGISLKEFKEKKNIIFAVEKVECEYHSPAFLEDEISVETEIEETSGARVVFRQKVSRNDKMLVSAKVTVFALDAKSFKPLRLPPEFKI